MKKRNGFRHLSAHDRDRIHALYGHGHSQHVIADVLSVHPATISRELARYGRTTWRYSATRAQADADQKRQRSKRPGMKIADHPVLRRYVIRELTKLRSPDEIAGRMKVEGYSPRVGKNAIYKWLYSDDGAPYASHLCTKRTRTRKQHRLTKRHLIPDRLSLRERENVRGIIHAERDLFVSPLRLHSKPAGLLVVVPEAQLLRGSILPSREVAVVNKATQTHFNRLAIDTCTADNGIENIRHGELSIPTYFCDPHAPWQKPHVENNIGLIRRWFIPKGTDLASVPDDVFQSQLHLLNRKYRKSLGYRSAYEVALEKGIITAIPRVPLSKAIAFR